MTAKRSTPASPEALKLLERFPALQAVLDQCYMVKFGGAAMEQDSVRDAVCRELALLSQLGASIIVVHGGGKEITRLLERLSIESRFIDGVRVTSTAAMVATEMVLSGLVNKDLASRITRYGAPAVGISGRDAQLIEAVPYRNQALDDFGETGDLHACNLGLIHALVAGGYVPVVSPVGESKDGAAKNLNADLAAAGLAGSLKAVKAIFLTDVAGVKIDKSVQPSLTTQDVKKLISSGIITGGMIPKVECAIKALVDGCPSAMICDASGLNIVTRAILGETTAGTVITN